jgi:hypothetical protein
MSGIWEWDGGFWYEVSRPCTCSVMMGCDIMGMAWNGMGRDEKGRRERLTSVDSRK